MTDLHVRHVRDALEREFRNLIDMSDRATQPEHELDQAFYSRALAAMAACHLSGCAPARAATSVIDGFDDGGFDAVMTNDTHDRLWLVQAKWSDRGSASLTVGDALKMNEGLRHILNSNFERFNSRFQKLVPDVDATIANPNVRITLVVALCGPSKLGREVVATFERIRKDANAVQELLDVAILGLSDFHNVVRRGISGAPIDVEIRLESSGHDSSPYLAYQGVLPAATIKAWYDAFGQQLFAENIRGSLGVTTVNQGLIETLRNQPELFLYYNNGITVLCDSIKRNAKHAVSVNGPVDLSLAGVKVVNGAQTVASIHQAVSTDAAVGGKAKVWVRLISLEGTAEGLAKEITLKTNTQNRIGLRDFVSLEPTQLRLRDEFSLSLGKTYVIKAGDTIPPREAGCSVTEAAQALACALPDVGLVARAKKNEDVLFDLAGRESYHRIFTKQTNAYRVWRCILVLRQVLESVAEAHADLDGRNRQVAIHGDAVVAHLVFHRLNTKDLDNPDLRWEDVELPRIPKLAQEYLNWLLHCFEETVPATSFVQSLFKNPEKTQALVNHVLQHSSDGSTAPAVATRQQRLSAVDAIVDAQLIKDGTLLEFRTVTPKERNLLSAWLAADANRAKATWLNDRSSPILWAADGNTYTPDALVRYILSHVTSDLRRKPDGSRYFFVPGRGSLATIAQEGLDDGG